MTGPRPGEEGFTLVELLVCVTILAVIVPAIAMAIIAGLNGTGRNSTRLAESHSAQQATALFGADVMSASAVQTGASSCGPPSLVTMTWTDPTLSGGKVDLAASPRTASYAVVTSAGEASLLRFACQGGATTSTVVARHLVSASTATITCSPACDATATTLTLAVTVSGAASDARSVSVPDYSFSLTAKRRSA